MTVQCKDCGITWEKRESTLATWHGRCRACASRLRLQTDPEAKAAFLVYARTGVRPHGAAHYNWKGGKPSCLDCGKPVSDYTRQRCAACSYKARRGKRRSLEERQRMREYLPRGPAHPNWKGGATPARTQQLSSFEHKLWREAVFARDNHTCVQCGARNGNGRKIILHPDHIIPYSERPDLAYDVTNGRTLCRDCHRATETFGWKQAQRLRKAAKMAP